MKYKFAYPLTVTVALVSVSQQ